jgi:hypothetical protein
MPGAKTKEGRLPLFDDACSLGGGKVRALPPERRKQLRAMSPTSAFRTAKAKYLGDSYSWLIVVEAWIIAKPHTCVNPQKADRQSSRVPAHMSQRNPRFESVRSGLSFCDPRLGGVTAADQFAVDEQLRHGPGLGDGARRARADGVRQVDGSTGTRTRQTRRAGCCMTSWPVIWVSSSAHTTFQHKGEPAS